ncbi:MAG: ubiquinol-cytochrome C chaperone family protein [Sphingomonadaceae bacterium]
MAQSAQIMSFLARMFASRKDPRLALQPLWHRTIVIAREPEWYRNCGVVDTLEGRFDMVVAVLSLVMLRMEGDPELAPKTALLAEFFVEDMDGQLRQAGVGDLFVGKHIGKLMSTLGGRIGAYRKGLNQGREILAGAAARNITLTEGTNPEAVAERMEALHERLAETSNEALLAGDIA